MAPSPTTPTRLITGAPMTGDPSAGSADYRGSSAVEAAAASDVVDARVRSDGVRERGRDHDETDEDHSEHALMVTVALDQRQSRQSSVRLVKLMERSRPIGRD